jgi:hypothetical protein
MIADLLMRAGDWDLSLSPDTPMSLRQAVAYGSVIYITPSYAPLATADEVRDVAFYGGLVTQRRVRSGRYGGPGLVGFISSAKGESGYIPNYAPLPALPFTMAQFVAAMFNYSGGTSLSNGLGVGVSHSPTATTVTEYDAADLPGVKGALDFVGSTTGNEWRITPQGKIDYGTASAAVAPIRAHDPAPGLFKTRQILIAPDIGASEAGGWHVLAPTNWDPGGSIDEYRNSAVVLNASRTTATARNASGNPVAFDRLDGSGAAVFNNTRQIISPSNNTTDIGNLAQAAANLYSTPQWDISCKVKLDRPASDFVVPGDSVLVYDPVEGIVGTSHVAIPGLPMAPYVMRVMGTQSPILDRYGVWSVDANDRDVVRDLTPYVEWEDGDTALTLGSPPRKGYLARVENLIE